MKQLPIMAPRQLRRAAVWLALCLWLVACGTVQTPRPAEPVAQQPANTVPSAPSATDLLMSRQTLCALPAAEAGTLSGTADEAGQLHQLLLMSCDMRNHRAAIGEMLADLRTREWPDGYAAFFDLVQASTDALETLEQQRDALQRRLDETIRGITHIEEAIDARRESGHLAE